MVNIFTLFFFIRTKFIRTLSLNFVEILRTLEKYGNLSVKNILKISPKLRISVLINFVLINKKKSVDLMPPV